MNKLQEQLIKLGLAPQKAPHEVSRKQRKNRNQATKPHTHRIREFLRQHRLNDKAADIAYYFQARRGTKYLYVTPEQQRLLSQGQLAVLIRNERCYLLSLHDAEQIRRWDADSDIFIDTRQEETPADADDPYAAFKVPDDLRW